MALIEEINKEDKLHIENRVKDWKKRVEDLYKDISKWLKGSDYNLKISHSIKFEMYEEPMAKVRLRPVKIDIAAIFKEKQLVGKIAPIGLWIMGANGAVELNTSIRNHKIVDTAQSFGNPNWKIIERKGFEEHLKSFNKSNLLSILKAEDLKLR